MKMVAYPRHGTPSQPGADKLFCCTVTRVRKLLPARHILVFFFSYCVTCIPSLASHPIHHVHGPLYWHRIRDSALRDIGHSSLFVEAGQISHGQEGNVRKYENWELIL